MFKHLTLPSALRRGTQGREAAHVTVRVQLHTGRIMREARYVAGGGDEAARLYDRIIKLMEDNDKGV